MKKRVQYVVEIKGVGDPPLDISRSDQIKFLRGNIPLKKSIVDHALVLDPEAKIEGQQNFWPLFFMTTTSKIIDELLKHPQVERAQLAGSFKLA